MLATGPVPTTEVKRSAPADAPLPAAKRFAMVSYDELFARLLKTFGPRVYVCTSFDEKRYEHSFFGIGRDGRLSEITLVFVLKQSVMATTRTFLFSFRVLDRQGLVDNIKELFDNGTPPVANITCGLTASEVNARMRTIFSNWLDYARKFLPVA